MLTLDVRRPVARGTVITLATTPKKLTLASGSGGLGYTPDPKTARLLLAVCTGSTMYWADATNAPSSTADMVPVNGGQVLPLNWLANGYDNLWLAGATATDKVMALPEGRA